MCNMYKLGIVQIVMSCTVQMSRIGMCLFYIIKKILTKLVYFRYTLTCTQMGNIVTKRWPGKAWTDTIRYSPRAVVLNLVGGTESHKFHTCIHRTLRSWKNKMGVVKYIFFTFIAQNLLPLNPRNWLTEPLGNPG